MVEICSDLLLFHSLWFFQGACFSSAAEDLHILHICLGANKLTYKMIHHSSGGSLRCHASLSLSACSYSIYQGICLRTCDSKMTYMRVWWPSVRRAIMNCTWLNVLSNTEEINRSEQSFSKSRHQMKCIIFKMHFRTEFFFLNNFF